MALLALAAVTARPLSPGFLGAALGASVAIDLDHLPGYLGWEGLIGAGPRPYSHSLAMVAVVAAFGFLGPRRYRPLMLAFAFGISAHLLRDLATGPGVPLFWPLDDGAVRLDYAVYAVALGGLAWLAATAPRRSRTRPARLASGIALCLAAVVVAAGAGARPAEARTVSIGAYVPGGDNDPSLIHGLEGELGRTPAIVLSYKDWTQAPFVYSQLDEIWSTGAMPMITWEPWLDSGAGVSLKAIADGAYDGYLSEAARAAAGWNRPLMLRFAQEPNGDWFPWGGKPAAYRAAWRHIHRIFDAAGADRVRWVWTPYVDSGGTIPFAKYYPGDRFVDWAGLDGINWGGSFPWRSFRQVFGASYQELTKVTSKPLILAETGSGETGGSKSAWISTMLDKVIPRMSHVMAVVFWSVDDHRGDIRVDSSSGALAALRHALRSPLYRSSRSSVNRAPKRLRKRLGKRVG